VALSSSTPLQVAVHDVQIDHVTSIGPGPSLPSSVAGTKCPTSASSTACLPWAHSPPVNSAGPGVVRKAAQRTSRAECMFSNYKFDHNLISVERLSGGWPPENTIVASPEDLGVHDLKDGISSDPRLCHEKGPGCHKRSPGVAAASDGRDLGADVDAVEAAIAALNNLGATSQVRD